MKKFFVILRIILFISLGVFLFWLVYKDIDIPQLFVDLKTARYGWVVLALFIALAGHFARALRWRLLVEAIGYKISPSRAFMAVLINYMANVAIPRAGEVSRPLVISRTENASLSKLMGTIIIERVFDMITLTVVCFAAFFMFYHSIKDYIFSYFNAGQNQIATYINITNILLIFAVLILIVISLFLIKNSNRAFKKHPVYIKIRSVISGFWAGILSIRTMKNKWLFIFYTLIIWITYYMMTFLVFFSLDATSHLGWSEGLFVLALSSLGFILPAPGGIGTYHAAAVIALGFYHIDAIDARLYAFIAHSSQTLVLLLAGAISYFFFLYIMKKQQNKNENFTSE